MLGILDSGNGKRHQYQGYVNFLFQFQIRKLLGFAQGIQLRSFAMYILSNENGLRTKTAFQNYPKGIIHKGNFLKTRKRCRV